MARGPSGLAAAYIHCGGQGSCSASAVYSAVIVSIASPPSFSSGWALWSRWLEPSKDHEEGEKEELAQAAPQIIDRQQRLEVRADKCSGEKVKEGPIHSIKLA